ILPERTFVAVYQGRARAADIAAMRTALARFAAARPTKGNLLAGGQSRATRGERGPREVLRLMGGGGARVAARARAHEGEGFWVSTARAIAAGIRLMSKSTFPLKVAATIAEGAGFLAAQTGERYPDDLARELDELRVRIRSHRTAG